MNTTLEQIKNIQTDFTLHGNDIQTALAEAFEATGAKVGQTIKLLNYGNTIVSIYERVDLRRKLTNRYGEPYTLDFPYKQRDSIVTG